MNGVPEDLAAFSLKWEAAARLSEGLDVPLDVIAPEERE